jgi:hypothetical protein
MSDIAIYYVYAYLREDLTPYYIGKGKGNRAYTKYKHDRIKKPLDVDKIQIIAHKLSEHEAHCLETKLITSYGRKDLGTGILRNLTNGGEGTAGRIVSAKVRQQLSVIHTGRTMNNEWRKKLSDYALNRTAEHRSKLTEAALKRTPEQNIKYGAVHKGKPWSDARRAAHNSKTTGNI